MATIWTIGHSTRTIEEFIAMLHSFNIKILADIRSLPGSKRYPQFNQQALDVALAQAGILYIHMPALGGRRKARPDSANTAWRSRSFMGYADYMETKDFKLAIIQLQNIAHTENVAYMCSEAVWWRCHRSLVSDYLKVQGWQVMHIMDIGKATEHPYTAPARVQQGNLFYDNNSS
ncbi:MAG: DUF488 domain-containing protein [Taibaiella sp.]|nr:DUF488 domain-containing protein [Taibaiella sp.]